jgi:hypothetical protein
VADKFYLENMLLPISLFMLLPFLDFVLKRLYSFRPLFILILGGIIVLRVVSIYNTHTTYTNRLAWYDREFQTMEKRGLDRIMMKNSQVPQDTLIMTWASGYESLLYSSFENPAKAKVIIINDDLAQFNRYMKSDTVLVPGWEWPDEKIRNRYFNIGKGKFVIQEVK